MKKNLLSVLILGLVFVNLVLTFVLMFSVVNTNKKTADLVMDIASVMQLELHEHESDEEVAAEEVSMEDTAVYSIADEMTILLTKGQDEKEHYALIQVSLSLNTKDKDYEIYGESIAEKESLIEGAISDVVSDYTADEIQVKNEEIKEKILKELQNMFESEFIYKVTFSKMIVQ